MYIYIFSVRVYAAKPGMDVYGRLIPYTHIEVKCAPLLNY